MPTALTPSVYAGFTSETGTDETATQQERLALLCEFARSRSPRRTALSTQQHVSARHRTALHRQRP
eukprot:3448645-Rhodomonas_salina.4